MFITSLTSLIRKCKGEEYMTVSEFFALIAAFCGFMFLAGVLTNLIAWQVSGLFIRFIRFVW